MASEQQMKITLARSCRQCIKAKRKCDRKTSRCSRCEKKNLSCSYKNEAISAYPDLTTACNSLYRIGDVDSGDFDTILRYAARSNLDTLQLDPPHMLLELELETVQYLIHSLEEIPATFAATGGTIFIHPQLYQNRFPLFLQNVHDICYLCTKTTSLANQAKFLNAILSTTAIFYNITIPQTLPSILEFVQALIVLLIITLFSSKTQVPVFQSQTSTLCRMLSIWTHKLFLAAPSHLPSILAPHSAWILAESVRRTIHMAYKVLGINSCARNGHFQLTLFLAALPVNRVSWPWHSEWLEDVRSTDLVSYREMGDAWERGELVGEDCAFEDLLLVYCKGLGRVRQRREKQRRLVRAGNI
jgi:hypothetical protein